MNMELFSRIKTLQVEQMSVKKRSMSFSQNLKRRKSIFFYHLKKKMFMSFSYHFQLKQGLYFRDVSQSKSQGSKDVQIILSCSVKKSRSHTESRLCRVQITTFDNTLAILQSYKERGTEKKFKRKRKTKQKAKFCILQNVCE